MTRNAFISNCLPAAILLTLLAVPAEAAQIVEPKHGVGLAYDEAQWSAKLDDDQNINLTCKTAACGGAGAQCIATPQLAKQGSTPQALLGYFGTDITRLVLGEFTKQGFDPKLVEELAIHRVGERTAGLSSFRTEDAGKLMRIWIAQVIVPFGAEVLVCVCPEDRYAAANAQWLSLIGAMAVPEDQSK
ncbi:hypothetical protein [Mesorhizobium amorphae]|uniref:hypothetical protein n=1 Tax=Mesorhizobium amorphae TaxID=71433 RepID=UPI00177B5D7E|nr:hypothetical protein [Mesorhizobium amorphae]